VEKNKTALQNREAKLWSHGVSSKFATEFRAPGAYPKHLLMCFNIFFSICFLFIPVYLVDLLFFLGKVALNLKEILLLF